MMDYLRVDVGWKMNWVAEVEPSKNHTLIRKKKQEWVNISHGNENVLAMFHKTNGYFRKFT